VYNKIEIYDIIGNQQ